MDAETETETQKNIEMQTKAGPQTDTERYGDRDGQSVFETL